MALTLNTIWDAYTKISGSATFEAVADQYVRIETSPGGEEILNAQVPTGKVWSVNVYVDIQETDAES